VARRTEIRSREQAAHDAKGGTMKRVLLLTAALTGLVVVAAAASAAPRNGTLVIRHQLRGCHTWSLNGGAFTATPTIHLARVAHCSS
jgi:hypothetical protein